MRGGGGGGGGGGWRSALGIEGGGGYVVVILRQLSCNCRGMLRLAWAIPLLPGLCWRVEEELRVYLR
jgi:hypothetical protein